MEKDTCAISTDLLISMARYFNVTTDYILGLSDIKRDLSGQIRMNQEMDQCYDIVLRYNNLTDTNKKTLLCLLKRLEQAQLEEEDEKERFLEGSKHKRLIPGYVALEVKENTCKISPVLYPEFRGKGYWKDARELLLERIFKERFFTEENGRRVPYRIDRVEIVLYQKPRDIARSTEGKLLFRDLKPYLQIFGYFSVVDRDNWSGEMYKYRDDIPEKYDDRPVYGIGMEDNPDADTLPPKRLVIVLSENEKEES